MKQFLAITKALSDETRVRALMALGSGDELCVCQVIDLLGLAPSTVSKHMTVLHDAGLVERRKDGRWHYYRLAGRDASPMVRKALRWAVESLRDQAPIVADAESLCCIKSKDLKELVACYSG
jgi:ArsR family transcriptional regulator